MPYKRCQVDGCQNDPGYDMSEDEDGNLYRKHRPLCQTHRQIEPLVCFKCNKGVPDVTLYRLSDPGALPRIWACEAHHPNMADVDADMLSIIKAIEESQ